jgi:hypothetical protein
MRRYDHAGLPGNGIISPHKLHYMETIETTVTEIRAISERLGLKSRPHLVAQAMILIELGKINDNIKILFLEKEGIPTKEWEAALNKKLDNVIPS